MKSSISSCCDLLDVVWKLTAQCLPPARPVTRTIGNLNISPQAKLTTPVYYYVINKLCRTTKWRINLTWARRTTAKRARRRYVLEKVLSHHDGTLARHLDNRFVECFTRKITQHKLQLNKVTHGCRRDMYLLWDVRSIRQPALSSWRTELERSCVDYFRVAVYSHEESWLE